MQKCKSGSVIIIKHMEEMSSGHQLMELVRFIQKKRHSNTFSTSSNGQKKLPNIMVLMTWRKPKLTTTIINMIPHRNHQQVLLLLFHGKMYFLYSLLTLELTKLTKPCAGMKIYLPFHSPNFKIPSGMKLMNSSSIIGSSLEILSML